MLISETIILREVRDSDIKKMCKLKNDPLFYPYFYELIPLTLEMQKRWVDKVTSDSNQVLFIIANKETDEFMGFCSLYDIDRRNLHCEFGRILISKEFSGKGIGGQALDLILEYAFNHLNMKKVYCEVFKNNKNAVSLYSKKGFIVSGEFKEHIWKDGKWEDVLYMEKIK